LRKLNSLHDSSVLIFLTFFLKAWEIKGNYVTMITQQKTVSGIFGFDRTLFGKKPKDKKWWMQSRRNVMNDEEAEAGAR